MVLNEDHYDFSKIEVFKGFNKAEEFIKEDMIEDSSWEEELEIEQKEKEYGYIFPSSVAYGTQIVGVLFSGGFNSTVALIDAIEEGYTVLPIIFDFNNPDEQLLIKTTLLQLGKVYKSRILPAYNIKFLFPYEGLYEVQDTFLIQPMIHFYLGFMDDKVLKKIESLRIGYIKEDVGLKSLKEYKAIYNSTMKYQKHKNIPKLLYPLARTSRARVLKKFDTFVKEHNVQIPCVSCFTPIFQYLETKKDLLMEVASCDACEACGDNNLSGSPRLNEYLIKIPIKVE